jgi:hypothetical protein
MATLENRWILGVVALAAVTSLGACSDARKSLIQGKKAPDEFAVYSRAPLTVPPEFGLRPPAPGTPRPEGKDPSGLAYQAMTGKKPARKTGGETFAGTPGEQALLRSADALNTDPMIRETVNRETSVLAEESQSVTDKLLFSDSSEFGTQVDPTKESQRLKENQALGKPLNEGEVPTIRRKQRGLLEGLFD